MYYHVLSGAFFEDAKLYARRRCRPGETLVYRDSSGKTIAGFKDWDRSALFLNLYDDEIEASFEGPARRREAA